MADKDCRTCEIEILLCPLCGGLPTNEPCGDECQMQAFEREYGPELVLTREPESSLPITRATPDALAKSSSA